MHQEYLVEPRKMSLSVAANLFRNGACHNLQQCLMAILHSQAKDEHVWSSQNPCVTIVRVSK